MAMTASAPPVANQDVRPTVARTTASARVDVSAAVNSRPRRDALADQIVSVDRVVAAVTNAEVVAAAAAPNVAARTAPAVTAVDVSV